MYLTEFLQFSQFIFIFWSAKIVNSVALETKQKQVGPHPQLHPLTVLVTRLMAAPSLTSMEAASMFSQYTAACRAVQPSSSLLSILFTIVCRESSNLSREMFSKSYREREREGGRGYLLQDLEVILGGSDMQYRGSSGTESGRERWVVLESIGVGQHHLLLLCLHFAHIHT